MFTQIIETVFKTNHDIINTDDIKPNTASVHHLIGKEIGIEIILIVHDACIAIEL
jgi:hypothetical protein